MMGFKELRLLAICLGFVAGASAQDAGLDVGIRVRGGSVFKHTNNKGAGHVDYGFGAEVTYRLSTSRAIFGELYTTYYSAWDYRNPMPATGYVVGTGAQASMVGSNNADRRKDGLDGLGLKGGYRAPLSGNWEWQAGLSLDRLKSRQEVTGLLSAGSTSATPAVFESLASVVTSQKVVPGLFVGARYKVQDGIALDISLVNTGYSRVNYLPYTYTGKAATTETTNERKTSLELGLVMRF